MFAIDLRLCDFRLCDFWFRGYSSLLQLSSTLVLCKKRPQRSHSRTSATQYGSIDLTSVRLGVFPIQEDCRHIIANLNTAREKYVVDACQLTRDGLSYFPVHYREYDQAFTLADDSRHYSFILAIPSNFTSVSNSLLLQFLLKSNPTRSYLPFAKLKYFFAPVRHCFSLRNDQENQNATPRTSTEMDFRPPSSPQSQTSDNFLDFAEEDTPAERQRKHDFWFARSWPLDP